MSGFCNSYWIKRTRKAHKCGWCGKSIDTGSAANYISGVCDGDFFGMHIHPECKAAIDATSYRELEDGWMPGEHARGRKDDEYNLPPEFSPDYRGRQQPPIMDELRAAAGETHFGDEP